MNSVQELNTNYFGLSDEFSSPENSRAAIIPVPYEDNKEIERGTKMGPKAILCASHQLELFDDELWVEPYKIGIQTVSDVDIKPVSAQTSEPFKELFDIVSPIIEFDRFPIILGGDRNISIGSVSACAKRYKDLSILQIDAQSNCSEPEDGENPHAIKSTINQIYSMLNDPKIAQVGVRSISQKEAHWVENNKPNIKTFWARQQDKWSVQDINSSLSNNVYVTIDVDALDNSIMPATAYPEPGGISWYLLMDILKNLCVKKNVVGVDIVGLAPIPNMTAPNLMVAKLLYKLIGYRFALDLGVTKKYL